MGSATRMQGAWFGALAGFGGVEHGYFEILQGNVAPSGLRFPSIGPPCVPEAAWHGCEPALTVIPNLLVTGVIAVLLGVATFAWVIFFRQHRFGGLMLALLSVALLLCGGGIIPAIIGVIGGVMAMWTPEPARHLLVLRRSLAGLWPWSLVALGVFLAGMTVAGYFSNDLMLQNALVILAAIPLLTVVSALSAWARDGLAD